MTSRASGGPSTGLAILLSGMVAGNPHQGGATWAVLQYALGLRRLGHEVVLVEEWMPGTEGGELERTPSAAYFEQVVARFGLDDNSALLAAGTSHTVGSPYAQLREFARRADLVLNVSGILTDPELLGSVPVRAYVDLDPAFNQLWQEQGIDMRFEPHNRFVTVGQAIGTPASDVPTGNRDWIATLPPVVLEHWPPVDAPSDGAYTTVGNWRGYGSVEHDGRHYGQRVHSMRPLMDLPRRTPAQLRLALAIHADETKDLAALEEHGWELTDPTEAAGTPERYRAFIQASRGELGIAKSGYVVSRSGWFSDRSACYLASARPVIAQETGFSDFLPTGEGLLAFETVDDAAAAIEEVERDHARHARAARAIAEDQLDSDKVLTRLLERILDRS